MTRRGRRRGSVESLLNLDSLVDVVTNLNGMLLLFAVFTTLIGLGKTYRVTSPLVRSVEKDAVFFECHSKRVSFVGKQTETQTIEWNTHDYSVTPQGRSTQVTLKDEIRGTTRQELDGQHSAFRKVVQEIVPAKQYAAFLVRPDSFEVFRAAREVLWRQGIQVGWEPWERPLAFGPGGREIKVP